MLTQYPLDALHAFLEAQKAVRLAGSDSRLHPSLMKRSGDCYALPAAWAPGGAIVLRLANTFPDTIPQVFLLRDAERPAEVVPHVNFAGEICCFHPSTVVNPSDPVGIVIGVLAKAEIMWTKVYTPAERLVEVEAELSAYWEQPEMPELLLRDDTVEHNALVGLARVTHPGKCPLWQVIPVTAKEARQEIGLVIDVPRDRVLDLLKGPMATLHSVPSTAAAIAVLKTHLTNSALMKRTTQLWLLPRCATSRGPILLPARGGRLLQTDKRHYSLFDRCIDDWWKAKQPLQHARVQDLRWSRLQARTAGPACPDPLRDVRLALVGCGSLGGFIADNLARAGIRFWLLLDDEVLRPENLARHLLNFESIHRPKATELARSLRNRFQDFDVEAATYSAQTKDGHRCLINFAPSVVLSATGDTNTDLTLSEACRRGELGDCCFVWVEPNLAAGHLVYQPSAQPHGLHDLHEVVGGDAYYYKFRIVHQPRNLLLSEPGCQVAYTPYAGADVQQFALSASRELAAVLVQRPTALVARRFVNGTWTTVS